LKRFFILLVIFLFPGAVLSSESKPDSEPKKKQVQQVKIPNWYTARRVMQECYDGWNVTVSLNGGLEYRQDMNEYTDQNVYSIIGEQTDTDDTESALSTYNTDKTMDADYSRDRQRTSGYVGVMMTVPLYSRKVRLSRKEATNKQIEHLADLYANFDGHRATMAALMEEKKVLKKVMIDSGQQGIPSYYQLLQDIEKSRALMKSAARKILAILENCEYVAEN
jgi:hypothetical protein